MQFELTTRMNGEMIQLDALMIDLETGQTLTRGMGLWGLGPDGRVSNTMFSSQFGHVLLHEQPDDADVLSMVGQLSGSMMFTVTLRIVGDRLEFNTRMTEGYDAQEEPPRVTATLQRVTGGHP